MSDMPMNKSLKTDWARIDAMTDDEIDTSDIPPLTEAFFKRAKVRMPGKVAVTVQVDPDVLAWFKAQGDDHERRSTDDDRHTSRSTHSTPTVAQRQAGAACSWSFLKLPGWDLRPAETSFGCQRLASLKRRDNGRSP